MMWLIGKMSRKNFKKTRKLFKKEFEAFKAYEKVFIKVFFKDFNKAEEEVAFETLKGAFENIKGPCKKLLDQPMSNVDSLFQAFENFCIVHESCVKKLGSILNLISKIKKFVIDTLWFKIEQRKSYDVCYYDHWKSCSVYPCNPFAYGDPYNAKVDAIYVKVAPLCDDFLQWCAPSKETDDYLREELDKFPINFDQQSELIRQIKRILMDNLHFKCRKKFITSGIYSAEDYDCTFSDNTDNKLLDVLEEIPDKLVQQEVMEVKVATVMLYEEWKKWAKVHNAFFSCFSI